MKQNKTHYRKALYPASRLVVIRATLEPFLDPRDPIRSRILKTKQTCSESKFKTNKQISKISPYSIATAQHGTRGMIDIQRLRRTGA